MNEKLVFLNFSKKKLWLNHDPQKDAIQCMFWQLQLFIISGITRAFFLPSRSFELFHGWKFARKLKFFAFIFSLRIVQT